MPLKEEILEMITDNRVYSGKEVRHLITSVKTSVEGESSGYRGDRIILVKKGDVFKCNLSNKTRPYLVLKVGKEKSICIGLSTTQNFLNICRFDCRVFGYNFINFNILMVENSYIRKNFLGVLEDKKAIREAINVIKNIKL